MKPIVTLLALFVPFLVFAQPDPYAGIIPAPASVKRAAGTFPYSAATVIRTDQPNHKAVKFLGQQLTNKWANEGPTVIELTCKGADQLPAEGYTLTVTPKKITIVGKDAGLFYGIQTLLQLLPQKKIPCVAIKDQPRFAWRGMMLDVSRHFFTVAEVKEFIDIMAEYKLNRFHWHLVDNEGWRIEIKKYPRLTQVGGYRVNQNILGNRDWPDDTPYGGYYTQQQIKEVVQYAADRFITTVPEIELPAHSGAALRAYPEYKVEMPAGSKAVHAYNIIFSPTEASFKFFEEVFNEVIPLFPGEYIHIGGDEANKLPWKESAFCQNLIKALKLKDEHGLQSYFIQRMEKFLNGKGKRIIGWDEILEGGLAPNATVMSWRGEAGGIASARQKHQVIMTPNVNGMYFDYAQSTSGMEPFTFGMHISQNAPLEKTYLYDPVPASLTTEEQQYIMGVQANIWTEVIHTRGFVQYMTIPRVFALAEVAWTPPANKDLRNFTQLRVPLHLAGMEAAGRHYRVPVAIGAADTTIIAAAHTFKLQPSVAGATIYYTLNGRVPGQTDQVFKDSLTLVVPSDQKRELRTMVVTPMGKRSIASSTIIHNRPMLPAVVYTANRTGLRIDSSLATNFIVPAGNKPKTVTFQGYLQIDTAGVYNFSLLQNGPASIKPGARLYIDNELVVDNETPVGGFPRKAPIPLAAGFHAIRLVYTDTRGNGSLQVTMSQPGQPDAAIPDNKLYY